MFAKNVSKSLSQNIGPTPTKFQNEWKSGKLYLRLQLILHLSDPISKGNMAKFAFLTDQATAE